jgi:hypothetical protein
MDVLNFLMYALPSGFISSFLTWLVGRRKRNNDMLSELQASINMLSSENRKILDENIQLRRENAELKAKTDEMLLKLSALTKEVERLRKEVINKKQKTDEAKRISNHSAAGVATLGLRHPQREQRAAGNPVSTAGTRRNPRGKPGERKPKPTGATGLPTEEDSQGGDTAQRGEDGCADGSH